MATFQTFMEIANAVLIEIDENQVLEADFTSTSNEELVRVKGYINLIYAEVMGELPDWQWARLTQTFSTVSGQKAYDTTNGISSSTDFEQIHLIQIPDNDPMSLLSYKEFKRRFGATETTESGTPHTAYVNNDKIYLHPTPDSIATVNLITGSGFTELSAHSDEPAMKLKHRPALYYGAAWLAKEHDNENSLYAQQYRNILNTMISRNDNTNEGHMIQPESDGWD